MASVTQDAAAAAKAEDIRFLHLLRWLPTSSPLQLNIEHLSSHN
jgi:hypothetical protein